MEDLNTMGKDFINEWNNEKHSTTKRVPTEFFENEKIKALQPLPAKRYRIKSLDKRIISNDGYISIGIIKYSVSIKYATKQLQYRIVYGFRVELYTMESEYIMSFEMEEGKYGTY